MRRQKNIIRTLAAILLILTSSSSYALSPLPESQMRIGSRGESVRILQQNLAELSLYSTAVDGVYGLQTAAAVRKLQAKLNLPADGICGKTTIHAFNETFANTNSSRGATPLSTVLLGKRIGIDPGHQKTADSTYEPIAPDSLRTKERMSTGAIGVKTGIQEYEITLIIAKKLQVLLEDAGATVVMTRTTNDVQVSNAERAKLMNSENVDCWVRIHCDYSRNQTLSGIHILAPAASSAPDIAQESSRLAELMLECVAQATGSQKLSVLYKADQTGFNWSLHPVITAELGYLSNPTEDVRLNRNYYQQACAIGLYEGLEAYFEAVG